MSPQPLTLTPHQQRPWRPATVSTSSHTAAAVKRTFATPVVRELPPRREARAVAGLW